MYVLSYTLLEGVTPTPPLNRVARKLLCRGGGGTGALRRWVGGGVGKMGFRAETRCYVVLPVLMQNLPATKSVLGWHDTPADG